MSVECPSEILQNSTILPDKLCGKYFLAEDVHSVLDTDSAQRIISIEEEKDQVIVPTTFLRLLWNEVLSLGKLYAKNAELRLILKMEEAQSKHTIVTTISLLKLCGFVKDVIMNGTNTIKQSHLERRKYNGTHTVRIDLLTGGFP